MKLLGSCFDRADFFDTQEQALIKKALAQALHECSEGIPLSLLSDTLLHQGNSRVLRNSAPEVVEAYMRRTEPR